MKSSEYTPLYRRIIVFSVIASTMVFGLFFLLLVPTIRSAKKSYSNFIMQKKLAEALLHAGATDSVIQSQIAGLGKSMVYFNDSFLRPGKEIEFIQFLESAGRENGIVQTIQLNDPKLDKQDDLYPTALLVIKIRGTFLHFLHYLIDLEHNAYYINVSSISLSNKPGDSLVVHDRAERTPRPFTILSAPEENGETAQKPVEPLEPEISATITGNIFWNYE